MKQTIIYSMLILSISILIGSCNNTHNENESINIDIDTSLNITKNDKKNIFITGEIITSNYVIIKDEYNSSQYSIIKKNNYFGLINDSNQIVLPIIYDSISSGYYGDYFFLKKDGLTGLMTYEGNLNIPIIYEHIEYDWNDKPNNLICFIVQKENKLGSIDFYNNTIIPLEYDGISNWVEYGPDAHYIKKDSLYGLINYNTGEIIIPPIYEFVGFWNNKCITARKDGLFGLINIQNKITIPLIYDKLHLDIDYDSYGTNENDRVFVEKDSIWFEYNLDGKLIQTDVFIERFDDDDLTQDIPHNVNDQLMVLPKK